MNEVRQRILLDVSKSISFFPVSAHKSLQAICVGSEYFLDYEEDEDAADFSEVIAIVDEEWLFNEIERDCIDEKMRQEGMTPRRYLQEEYTYDDSTEWFDEANRQGKIMMVAFN